MLGNQLRNWVIATICLLMLGAVCLHPASKDSNTTSMSVRKFPSGNVISPPSTMSSTSYLIGHFEYQNMQSGNWMPLAFAQVDIRYTNNTLIDRTYTDIYGNFTSAIDVPPSGATIKCSVSTSNPRVMVLNLETNRTYSADTLSVFVEPNQNKTITQQFLDERKWVTVFSLHSGLNKGWYYIYNTVGSDVLGARAFYPYGQIPHYVQEDKCMYLPVDTYNRTDTILHEYGHYSMHFMFNWHWPTNATGDYPSVYEVVNRTMAWTEGWAYYFPLAVKNSGQYDGLGGTYDFENQSWATLGWADSDSVIGRVAGALFDLYDLQNDAPPWNYERQVSGGFNRTWQIMKTDEPQDFLGFWVRWNGTYYSHPKSDSDLYNQTDWTNTLMSIFQNSIDYRGLGDVDACGCVTGTDIGNVAWRFGAWEGPPPSPRWDYLYDINHNGHIDGNDVAIASQHFGESYDC